MNELNAKLATPHAYASHLHVKSHNSLFILEIMLRSITIMDTRIIENMICMKSATININEMLFVHIVCNMGMLAHFVILKITFILILI